MTLAEKSNISSRYRMIFLSHSDEKIYKFFKHDDAFIRLDRPTPNCRKPHGCGGGLHGASRTFSHTPESSTRKESAMSTTEQPTTEQATDPNALLQDLFREIGHAVFFCQSFEWFFTIICKMVLLPKYKGMPEELTDEDFKNASMNLFKELKEVGVDIDPAYEDRFKQFIEDRHVVVHRGLRTFKLDLQKYHDFAQRTAREACGQSMILYGMFMYWLEKLKPNLPDELRKQLEEFTSASMIQQLDKAYETIHGIFPQLLNLPEPSKPKPK